MRFDYLRGILLPAALAALGERTWCLRRSLRRVLPDRDVPAEPTALPELAPSGSGLADRAV